MKITFSLNHIRHVVNNDYRLSHCHDLVRSYLGYKPGDYFDYDELEAVLRSGEHFIVHPDKVFGDKISIRGSEITLEDVFHAIAVNRAFVKMQSCENAIASSTGTLSQWYKAVKAYKLLLEATEW